MIREYSISLFDGVSTQAPESRRPDHAEAATNILFDVYLGACRRGPTDHIASVAGLVAGRDYELRVLDYGADERYALIVGHDGSAGTDLAIYGVSPNTTYGASTVNIGTGVQTYLDANSPAGAQFVVAQIGDEKSLLLNRTVAVATSTAEAFSSDRTITSGDGAFTSPYDRMLAFTPMEKADGTFYAPGDATQPTEVRNDGTGSETNPGYVRLTGNTERDGYYKYDTGSKSYGVALTAFLVGADSQWWSQRGDTQPKTLTVRFRKKNLRKTVAITGASFNNGTRTLTATGAFAGWSISTIPNGYGTTRQTIRITGGTGVTAGDYQIESKTSDNAVVLTADIGGSSPSDVTADRLQGYTSVTYTASSKTVTATGAFADYEWEDNDHLFIAGGTNVTPGYYRIASKTSDNAVVLTAHPTGNAGTDQTDWCIDRIATAETVCSVDATTIAMASLSDLAAAWQDDLDDAGYTTAAVGYYNNQYQITSPHKGEGAQVERALFGGTFVGERLVAATKVVGTDGSGATGGPESEPLDDRWTAVAEPGSAEADIDSALMPVTIERTSSSGTGTFSVELTDWAERTSGTSATNPAPRIWQENHTLSDMIFSGGRLVFIGGPYLAMSSSRDFRQFYLESEGEVVASDPIDYRLGGQGVLTADRMVPFSAGSAGAIAVVLTTNGEQVEIRAAGPPTPTTVYTAPTTTVETASGVAPVSLGSRVYFALGGACTGDGLVEYSWNDFAQNPDIEFVARHASDLFETSWRKIAAVPDRGLVFLLPTDGSGLTVYRSVVSGVGPNRQRVQSAVFSYTFGTDRRLVSIDPAGDNLMLLFDGPDGYNLELLNCGVIENTCRPDPDTITQPSVTLVDYWCFEPCDGSAASYVLQSAQDLSVYEGRYIISGGVAGQITATTAESGTYSSAAITIDDGNPPTGFGSCEDASGVADEDFVIVRFRHCWRQRDTGQTIIAERDRRVLRNAALDSALGTVAYKHFETAFAATSADGEPGTVTCIVRVPDNKATFWPRTTTGANSKTDPLLGARVFDAAWQAVDLSNDVPDAPSTQRDAIAHLAGAIPGQLTPDHNGQSFPLNRWVPSSLSDSADLTQPQDGYILLADPGCTSVWNGYDESTPAEETEEQVGGGTIDKVLIAWCKGLRLEVGVFSPQTGVIGSWPYTTDVFGTDYNATVEAYHENPYQNFFG